MSRQNDLDDCDTNKWISLGGSHHRWVRKNRYGYRQIAASYHIEIDGRWKGRILKPAPESTTDIYQAQGKDKDVYTDDEGTMRFILELML